jgi:hypothetical protein
MRAWRIPLLPVGRQDSTARRRSSDHHSPRVALCNKTTIRFHCSNINFNIISRYIDWFLQVVLSILFFVPHTFLHIYPSLYATCLEHIFPEYNKILKVTMFLLFKYIARCPVTSEVVVNHNYIVGTDDDNSYRFN